MKVSTTSVTITPQGTFYLDGYLNDMRQNPGTGVHDDPLAVLLLMEESGERALFVGVDVCLLSLSRTRGMRRQLCELLGLKDELLVVSTVHSHSCPNGLRDGSLIDHETPGYADYVSGLVVQAASTLPQALVETEKAADDFGRTFAERHCNDAMHYFVGAGNQYGSTYSYAMCYWEEQHWLRSKSIHAAEFFHGTLEIVDKDTPVTLFMGEDAQRPLSERVKNFLPRVCGNYTIIDAADYPLTGISPAFRGDISHLVTHAVTQRIDAHMEQINRHPMEIRRYYRQFPY